MARLHEARWERLRATPFLAPACRCCGLGLEEAVADLGLAPLSGAPVPPGTAMAFHPLRLMVCSDCRLVQVPDPAPAAAPPPAPPWREEGFAAAMIAALRLDSWTPVAEVGAGAMLPAFARRGVPVLQEEAAGFDIHRARRLRAEGLEPALLLVPDALAAAPSLHGLAAGLREFLAPGGVLALEVPSLLAMMQGRRIDLLRHGRLSWFTLATAEMVLAQHGLVVFDARRTGREGGGLRLLARHAEDRGKPLTPAIEALRQEEAAAGLGTAEAYRVLTARLLEAKCALLDFLVGAQRAGRRVAAAGVPAATTLLTWCGAGPELLAFTVDEDPARHGLVLAGTTIPIRPPAALAAERPDFVLSLDAAGREALARRLPGLRPWGGRFVVPLPTIDIV
ncbi:methyltransferase C-terminal domain-containing protein [Falsiroseomonas ponticola]|uniref:methyltransferase C-terminal domain-containing protein n=1 Tax=Falsiroseomonas ponticola TaxID=2786951 RepID=UPI0019329A30|nr:methyltransferase C-terminal domain-containing protein [Roseomonas ponticola]